jgi:hypothetical protein
VTAGEVDDGKAEVAEYGCTGVHYTAVIRAA